MYPQHSPGEISGFGRNTVRVVPVQHWFYIELPLSVCISGKVCHMYVQTPTRILYREDLVKEYVGAAELYGHSLVFLGTVILKTSEVNYLTLLTCFYKNYYENLGCTCIKHLMS